MTGRVLVSMLVFLGLAGLWAVSASGTPRPPLLSRHSEPAAAAPDTVIVTADGKLFHRAGCPYVHGPARAESGSQAIAEGFTPCTRCLPRRASIP